MLVAGVLAVLVFEWGEGRSERTTGLDFWASDSGMLMVAYSDVVDEEDRGCEDDAEDGDFEGGGDLLSIRGGVGFSMSIERPAIEVSGMLALRGGGG